MRFYPIHVIIKDFSFMFLYIVLSGSFGQVGLDGLLMTIFFSLRMISGFIVINLILQTAIYLGLKHYVRWRKMGHKFIFGLALHIPTILFWVPTMNNDDKVFGSLTSIILSSLVSGTLYVFLNGGLKNFKRKTRLQEG
jgi:hypothetical protein